MKKIGLSLSFCIRDILAGRINLQDVDYIITSCCRTNGSLDNVIRQYMEVYWCAYPVESVRELLEKLDLRFPRETNPDHMPWLDRGHWVEKESEIRWCDERQS